MSRARFNVWRELFSDAAFAKFLTLDLSLSALVGVLTWRWTDASFNGFLAFLFSVVILTAIGHHAELALTRRRVAGALRVHVRLLESHDETLYTEGYKAGRAYSDLLARDDEFFLDYGRRLLRECASQLSRVADGTIRISDRRTVYDVLQDRLYAAKRELFYTSLVKYDPFWATADGNSYLAANLERAKDVSIQRIFIIEDISEITPALADVIWRQCDAGIDVRVARSPELSTDLRRDMGIYDDTHVGFLTVSPMREVLELTLSNNKDDVEKAQRLRTLLRRNSVEAANVLPSRSP